MKKKLTSQSDGTLSEIIEGVVEKYDIEYIYLNTDDSRL